MQLAVSGAGSHTSRLEDADPGNEEAARERVRRIAQADNRERQGEEMIYKPTDAATELRSAQEALTKLRREYAELDGVREALVAELEHARRTVRSETIEECAQACHAMFCEAVALPGDEGEERAIRNGALWAASRIESAIRSMDKQVEPKTLLGHESDPCAEPPNVPLNGWISVEDSLPPMETPVLVRHGPFDAIAAMIRVDAGDDGWLWGCTRWNWALNELDGYEADDDYHVTHWMLLPKPPATQPSTD